MYSIDPPSSSLLHSIYPPISNFLFTIDPPISSLMYARYPSMSTSLCNIPSLTFCLQNILQSLTFCLPKILQSLTFCLPKILPSLTFCVQKITNEAFRILFNAIYVIFNSQTKDKFTNNTLWILWICCTKYTGVAIIYIKISHNPAIQPFSPFPSVPFGFKFWSYEQT